MRSKILYDVVSLIDDLESPQIHSYVLNDELSRPVSFSFRFKKSNCCDYLDLSNLVTSFDGGNLAWVMYKYGSKKNYTIEPLETYLRRRSTEKDDTNMKTWIGSKEYKRIQLCAISDVPMLAAHIESGFPGHKSS